MDTTKLRQIITNKNSRLEEEALHNAASLINAIALEQKAIAASTQKIATLRKELAVLEVEQMDAAQILGE